MNRPHVATQQQRIYEHTSITVHFGRVHPADPNACTCNDSNPTAGGNRPPGTETGRSANSTQSADRLSGCCAPPAPNHFAADPGCHFGSGAETFHAAGSPWGEEGSQRPWMVKPTAAEPREPTELQSAYRATGWAGRN